MARPKDFVPVNGRLPREARHHIECAGFCPGYCGIRGGLLVYQAIRRAIISKPITGFTATAASNTSLGDVSYEVQGNWLGVVGNTYGPIATRPALLLARTNDNNLILEWPTNAAGFVLEYCRSLSTTTNWTQFNGVPAVNEQNYRVGFPMTYRQTYYRLRQN
jgi:hypothetical protein